MVKKITITIALILGMGAFLFSQEVNNDAYTKHQIGINASKFVVLFNEQVNNLDLTYRHSIKQNQRLRVASSFDVSTEDGDITDYEVRLGYDFNIRDTKRWNFYSGFDLSFGQSITSSTDRINTRYGPSIFLGALFKIGKYFSLSTEPSIAIIGKNRKDPNSFDPDANSTWTEFKLQNIGQITVGFHF